MDKADKYLLVLFGVLGVAGLTVLAYGVVGMVQRTGSLQPGQVPFTAVDLPQQSTDPVVAGASPCRAILRVEFHLRATEILASRGTVYRGGTEVTILRAGTLRRGLGRIYQVRVPRTGATGWVFILPTEIIGDCAGADEAEIARRATARAQAPATTPPVVDGQAPVRPSTN